jgi:outer membrane protein insertion porin family
MSSSASASESARRARRAAAALALIFALAVRGPGALRAQDVPQAVVERIVVTVDGRPGEAGLRDLISLRPGDPFQPALVDQAIKRIFRTGLFADVRVERTGAERIELAFILSRKVFTNAVRFRGVKVSAARLSDALVSLRPGGYLDEDRIPAAVAEVREGLRREGFFGAVVACDVMRKAGASTADLVFRTTDWKSFRVGGIEVEWKAEIPERTLLKTLKTKVGDLYVPSRFVADLERLSARLAKSGYRRADVRLAGESFDEQNSRVDLRVEILPQEKITVVVNGAKVPLRILEPIWEERVFEPWGLSEGEARVLSYLRRQGYLFATVQSRIEKPSGEIRIIHDVTRGDKYKIVEVDFRGNAAYSTLDLKNRLAVREGVPLFSFLRSDRLFTIPREVESFYKENGFADIQVRLELVREKAGVKAVFDVREGPRTTVEAIRIDGASVIPAAELARELVSREGGPFFAPNVQRDVSQIEAIYLNRGFRGSEVAARVERPADGRVSLVYEITEGTPVTIRDVFVTGSRATRNGVIQREIRVDKGGVADFSLVQDTKRRLENLGIFSEVRVDEIQTGPGDEVVVVTVREGEKHYVGLGLGFESEDPITASLASWPGNPLPRGSAEYIRNNFFGLGAQVGILGQIALGANGVRELRTVASWNQLHLLGLPIPTTLLVWAEREARDWGPEGSDLESSLDRRGISFSAVKALSRSRLLLGSLSVTRTSLKNVDLANLPANIDRRFLPYSAALVSLNMSWERRDDTLNPTRGYYFSAVGEVGLPVFGKGSSQPGQEDPNPQSDYQKIFLKGQFYKPITSGLNLGVTARLGLGHGLRNLPEFFFAGGSNTFRGEEFELLGPFDPTTLKPFGGAAVLLVNTELTFPVFPSWKALRLASFLDLGNVYATLGEFRPFDLQGAVGAGIRYRTPLGPVRVEIAWKLWGYDVQDRRGRPLIFLTIGNIF